MPLYEYECESCHQRVEKIQKFSDAPLTDCPHCGGHLERTITAAAVQFAGGGWYKDLYSSVKPSAGSASGGSTSSTPSSTSDTSSTSSPSAPSAPASAPTKP
ncbi:zinc ribbon domain-containing protein [Granulicella cerasi]|uniref:Zinc ribbon domain-containing protein n=1 Tax=Granulicella cerasi TaxID=741063 RepID=A0ABW1ZA88_9BACT|nr:zinc ribbon domain-containing protein [Granulicella cerasi]